MQSVRLLSALAHLSPHLAGSQIESIAQRQGALESGPSEAREVELLGDLVLCAPRQLLLNATPNALLTTDIERSLQVASAVLSSLMDRLSGIHNGEQAYLSQLVSLSRQTISSVSLLIPELAKCFEFLPGTMLDCLDSLVDSLSWIVEARGRVKAIAEGRILEGEFIDSRSRVYESLPQLQDHCWLGLTFMLDPRSPLSSRYPHVQKRLTNLALRRIEDDLAQGGTKGGRLPLELFLLTVDPAAAGEAFVTGAHDRIRGQLARFTDGELLPPGYVDGVAAAAAAWMERQRLEANPFEPDQGLVDLSQEALKGRALIPDVQSFLMRCS